MKNNMLRLSLILVCVPIFCFSAKYRGKVLDVYGKPIETCKVDAYTDYITKESVRSNYSTSSGYYSIGPINTNQILISYLKKGYEPKIIIGDYLQNRGWKDITLYPLSLPTDESKTVLCISNITNSFYTLKKQGSKYLVEDVQLSEGTNYYYLKSLESNIRYFDSKNSLILIDQDQVYNYLISTKSQISNFYFFLNDYKLNKDFAFDDENLYHQEYQLKISLNKGRAAHDFILDKMKSYKIVFLSEDHNIINPIIFLAESLESLYYKGGLRYIFLEREIPNINIQTNSGNLDYSISLMYGSGRYEWKYLYEKVHAINKTVQEKDKIKLIWAEEGLKLDLFEEKSIKLMGEILYKRNHIAYSNILQIYKNSAEDEKILIFYGGGHGGKFQSISDYGSKGQFIDYPLGSLLYNDISNNYCNLSFYYYNYNNNNDYRQLIENDNYKDFKYPIALDISNTVFDTSYNGNKTSDYIDSYIVVKSPKYGVPSGYIKNKTTIKILINNLKYYYIFSLLDQTSSYDDKVLMDTCYLLRLHLGRRFHYTYYNSRYTLYDTIIKIERWFKKYSHNIKSSTKNEIILLTQYFQVINSDAFGKNDPSFYFHKGFSMYKKDINSYIYSLIFSQEISKRDMGYLVNQKNMYNSSVVKNLTNKILKYKAKKDSNSKMIIEYLKKINNMTREKIKPYYAKQSGAIIFSVSSNSKLENKLQFGDLIVKYGNVIITNKESLEYEIKKNLGKDLEIKFYRNNELMVENVKIINCNEIDVFSYPDNVLNREDKNKLD